MDSIFSDLNKELSEALAGALGRLGYENEEVLSTLSASKAFGDISSSVALKIAKRSRSSPAELSKKIISSVKKPPCVSGITNENGFINFHLDRTRFCAMVLGRAKSEGEAFTRSKSMEAKTAIIEYPSVNPNKPWHIGHLRNALLGDCLSNLYEAVGYSVERENYIDDLGLQMAEIVWWYQKNNLAVPPNKKFDHWLGEEYVKINAHIDGTDTKPEIERTHTQMEQAGTYESKLAREIAAKCLEAQCQTSFSFNIYQDLMVWESDIVREGVFGRALTALKSHGIAKEEKEGEYKGCTVIDLSAAQDLPAELKNLNESVKVLVKSDGTSTYLAKDIAFHMWKFGLMGEVFKYSLFLERQPNGEPIYTTSPDGKAMKFGNADAAVNIIDTRQSHPQSILRLAFASLGRGIVAERIKHIAYGEVELESGSLSGRKGTWMGYSADEILEEAVSKARTLISSRFEFGDAERERVAKSVALAAVKFEFLKYGIEKKIVFSWEKAMNFEGSSGPYQLYMHARANRILEDSGSRRAEPQLSDISDIEFGLVKHMAMAKDIVEKARNEGRPNIITEYINELSSSFSTFYEFCPVLKAPGPKREFRIALTELFSEVSASMLRLIGIEPLQRM
jgi:arginyl-tRNA synthetase